MNMTIFGIKVIDLDGVSETVEVAVRIGVGNGKVTVAWINALAHLLPDEHPVIPMDNDAHGVETLGDLRKLSLKKTS